MIVALQYSYVLRQTFTHFSEDAQSEEWLIKMQITDDTEGAFFDTSQFVFQVIWKIAKKGKGTAYRKELWQNKL